MRFEGGMVCGRGHWMPKRERFLFDFFFVWGIMLSQLRLGLYGLTSFIEDGGLNGFVLFYDIYLNGLAFLIELELLQDLFAAAPLEFFDAFLHLLLTTFFRLAALVASLLLLPEKSDCGVFGGRFNLFFIGVEDVMNDVCFDLVHSEPGVLADEIEDLFVEIFILAVVFLEQALHLDDVLDVSL